MMSFFSENDHFDASQLTAEIAELTVFGSRIDCCCIV